MCKNCKCFFIFFSCKVLKSQLQNYKQLIQRRVSDNVPVITYQDNMQLMRTSMRHLRLSKLKQDKTAQQKMWDFTVRGYRVADISGLEELFANEATASTPQMELSSLKYEDITISMFIINSIATYRYFPWHSISILLYDTLCFLCSFLVLSNFPLPDAAEISGVVNNNN